MRLLILGAGIYQKPLIEKAISHGYYVTVASNNINDPGMQLASDQWEVESPVRDNDVGTAQSTPGSRFVALGLGHVFPFQGKGLRQQRRTELQSLSSGTAKPDLKFLSA